MLRDAKRFGQWQIAPERNLAAYFLACSSTVDDAMRLAFLLLTLLLSACATSPNAADKRAAIDQQGNLRLDGVPASDPGLSESLRRYQNMRPATFQGWLPGDRGVLISVRFGEVAQLAAVTTGEGMRSQLTFFDEPIAKALVSPDPSVNGAIFTKDRGGDEYFQLHFLNFADGTTRLLTDGASRNEQPVFARDGRRFAYASTRRTKTDFDVYIGDVTSSDAHRVVLQQGGTWYPLDFSPDGQKLLVVQWFSISDSRLHVLDLNSGELRRIELGRGTSADSAARFDLDGKHIYALTDVLGEYVSLVRVSLDNGVVVPLLGDESWDVEQFEISPDGRYLAVVRNVDGSSKLKVYDRHNDDAVVSEMSLDFGVMSDIRFNGSSTEFGLTMAGPQVPGDVFSRRINSGLLTRWTRGETGGIDPASFAMPELLRFGAHDTDPAMMGLPRQIPFYAYRPSTPGPHPVVIVIHGGPEAQSRPQFSEFIQFLVRERNVAVIVPNVRGSAGYGKTYLALDNGKLREDSVKDIGSLIGWIKTKPEFDASRIGVYGGSYGGYMVLASMVHFGEQIRAGVDIVGISNFVTFLKNTNPYRVDQRRPEYGDERDPDMAKFLESISPLNRASEIRSPLFVIQGANDPRVPQSEAEQILRAVRANDVTAWYLLALDEGHGFKKKSNRDRMSQAVIQFFDRYLLPVR